MIISRKLIDLTLLAYRENSKKYEEIIKRLKDVHRGKTVCKLSPIEKNSLYFENMTEFEKYIAELDKTDYKYQFIDVG